jgi:hypothetical protein
MELVIMKIKTTRNWEKQHAEGSKIPSYKRAITRQDNEEGRANRTVREMQEIADQYSKTLDDVLDVFGKVNGRKQAVKDHYADGGKNVCWNPMEDAGIKDKESEMYKYIVNTKGEEAVLARREWLNIV